MNDTFQMESCRSSWEEVHAYAHTRHSRSLVAYPQNLQELKELLAFARRKGHAICPRGQGYSYADMILNDGHIILDTSRMDKILHWDGDQGVLTAQPGVRLADIFRLTLPQCWYLPSCPGGMNVTVAGAVSNNIHGKDSWKNGNFGSCVESIRLLTAQGEEITVSLGHDADIFRAVIGGMGLLGLVVEVKLKLLKVPSAFVEEETIPTRNIEEAIDLMEASRPDFDFIVGWVDGFAQGRGLGRGYIVRARWSAGNSPVDPQRLDKSLTLSTKIFDIFPSKSTWTLLKPLFGPQGMRWMNRAMYYLHRSRGVRRARKLFTEFNFMHNKIPDLNYVYYPQGFLEFQPLIPRSRGKAYMKELLELCHRHQAQSLLCGIKVHEGDDFLISYAGGGYSIGIDIQVAGRSKEAIRKFAHDLFALTEQGGGKIYLAKDECLTKDFFRKMYPKSGDFLAVKRRLDPEHIFASDLYRRLFHE